jgi:hypothetical protein
MRRASVPSRKMCRSTPIILTAQTTPLRSKIAVTRSITVAQDHKAPLQFGFKATLLRSLPSTDLPMATSHLITKVLLGRTRLTTGWCCLRWIFKPADSLDLSGRALLTIARFPDSIRVMYSAAGDSIPEATTWAELGRFKVSTSGWQRRGFRAPSAGSTGRFAIRYRVARWWSFGFNNSNYIGIDALTVERVAATPVFAASPSSVSFGTVSVGGSSAPQSISLGNAGQGTLTITGVSLTGADASQFALTNTNTLPANLGNGQSITVSVTFSPTSTGPKSASLQVTYTGATGSPATIPLTGTGFVPAQVAILVRYHRCQYARQSRYAHQLPQRHWQNL